MPIIIPCEQGSPEWFAARAGIPTASEFEAIIGVQKSGKPTAAYSKLMRRLAAEQITGTIQEPATSQAMRRGHELEPMARNNYALITDTEPQIVGFMLADDKEKGFSPDALVGENGILEIKTKTPELVIECIENNIFPLEHKAQCQGGLWIAEREWVDIYVYWPEMKPFIKREYRDETYIAKLAAAIEQFNEKKEKLIEKINNYEPFQEEAA